MKKLIVVFTAASCITLIGTQGTTQADSKAKVKDALLPSNAQPGECFARVYIPPQYQTKKERVLRREASKKTQIIPAKYEKATQKVLVQEASKKIVPVPATYEWVEEKVLVEPASKKMVPVPAKYETITEKLIDQAAHVTWKKGKSPISAVDNSTGEIMCKVEVPATYKTIKKQKLVSAATVKEVEIPAKYKVVRKKVVKTPATHKTVEIPAKFETVKVTKLITPPQVKYIDIPAEFDEVVKKMQTASGKVEWQPILCETNMTKNTITNIQANLKKEGFYSGKVDGQFGAGTTSAIAKFQKAKGLSEGGQLTWETVKALGVKVTS